MKTTRNTSSGIFRRRWQTGKRKFIAPSVIVLFMMILISVFTGEKSYSQGVGISDVSITPHASSILELRSTVLGFLAPRMTEGQRDGIGSPATGLIVYNTTTNKLNIYDGTTWRVLFSGNLGVNSVTGTLNRITISGTSADPIIDIASNYAGQASISILGTVTTGTWNASVINVPYGGTGLSSGISGGIPYFSTTTTMASSSLLTANGVVLGGGTGGAPSTIGVGPANTVLRGTGVAPIFGQVITDDISDNAITNIKMADNSVNTLELVNSSVTTVKIADANVTPIKIEPGLNDQVLVTDGTGTVVWINKNAFGAIADQISIEGLGTFLSPFKVKDLGIVTSMLADGAVTTIKIANGAVTNPKLALNSVLTGNIVDETILSEDIKDLEVKTSDLANLGVTTAKIADDAITNIKMADNSVNTLELVNSSVTTAKIADDAITNIKMADNSVNTLELVNSSVTTAKIADANVTPIKIEPGLDDQVLVTDGTGTVVWINKNAFGAIADQISIEGLGTFLSPFKVKDLGIVTSMLADGAVTTIKIADGAVTNPKLALNSVLTGNIVDETILSEDIKDLEVKTSDLANLGVTTAKIADDAVTNIKMADNSVNTLELVNSSVTTAKIADANVTPIKIEPGLNDQVLVTDGTGTVVWINKNAFGAIADQISIEGLGTFLSPFKVKDLGIVTSMLADGAVTTIKIADGAVTNPKLALNSVLTGNIVDETILSEDIKDLEVKTSDLANLGVTTAKIADDAITNIKMADNSVNTLELVNSSVTTAKIADDAITNIKMADNSVNTLELVNSSVTTAKIADANVTPIKIEPGLDDQVLVTDGTGTVVWINKNAFGAIADQISIEGLGTFLSPFKVKDLGIVTSMLADGAVTTIKIADGAVTNPKLALNSVLTGNIVDETILSEDIKDLEVKTSDLANLGVTTAKIADDAVTNIKMADNSVNTLELVNSSVTTAKIADDAVTNIKMADNSVNTLELVNGSVTTAKIADANVTVAKLVTAGAGDASKIYSTDGLGVPILIPISNFATSVLLNGQIFIGDALNTAVGRIMSGDATIDNIGVLTISDDAITTIKILDGNVTDAKIATVSGTKVTGNIAGNAANVTGVVGIPNGGTGQITSQLAINALAGGVTSGQYLRGDGSNVLLSTIQAGDVPILNQNTTGNALTATTATNIAGGLSGTIPYQSAPGTTLMTAVGTSGQVLTSNGGGAPTWTTATTGTVTSVGLSLPSFITVTNSPVTSTGTLTGTLASQSANSVFAAPDGSAGAPDFRLLTSSDIPALDWSKITTGTPTTLAGYGITDAMSTSHPANVITIANISNWNTAYGWGDHSLEGYLTSYTETDPVVRAINGIVKSNGTVISAAVAGSDYEVPLTFSTGLTRTTNTVTVNTSQNITQLSNLTSNGIVSTSGGDGTLGVLSTTGTGSVVLANTPTLISPNLGAATATSINGNIITAGTGTLTIAAGSTLNATANATVSGTNTGDNAANTISNTYADGKVADAINDGTTTVAPSQNAVFDALTLKAAIDQTFFLGTTSIAINRASGALALTGITSIDGNAATATLATTATNIAGGLSGTIPYQSAPGTTLMTAVGTSGQVLTSNGGGAPTWTTATTGTVTSVGLSLPSFITVTNSPVTSTGTLTGTLASQSANSVFAAPDGSAGAPDFRLLTSSDIPALDWSKITTGTPTTLAGYGITDAMSTSHPANVITIANISNWNTAYGWGDHSLEGYLTSYTETDPVVRAINGIVKSNGTVISAAVAGSDYEVPLTFSTGLTRTTNTVTVNTSQNITQLSNLTSNGIVSTSGGDGTLGVLSTTGTGSVVLANTPTLISPNLGAATATSINGNIITAGTGTLTIAAGSTLNATANATVSGTNTGDNAANTTSNTYADGKVADAINDGTTTVAPSQNAVFDALTLKAATNQTFFLGTTSIAINRASGALALTGITSIDGNAATATLATRATNIAGGLGGQIPYQSAVNTTSLLAAGTPGQVLTSGGAGAPTWTTPTVGTVTSVSGTANRISVGGTASAPIIDIAGSYMGQNSITTLGTITTGIWNAGAVTSSGAVTGNTIVKTGGLATQFLKADGSVDANTYLTGNQSISFAPTGDVTGSTTGTTTLAPALTITNKAVTLAKMADMATGTLFYRKTAGAGAPEVQTLATLKTDLGLNNANNGDVSLAVIGTTPNASGASLVGQVLTLQPADATFGGVVTTGAQTFAGEKTWNDYGIFNGGIYVTGGAIFLNNNSSSNSTFIGTGTTTGLVTIGGGSNQTISIGNGAAVKTVNLGSSNTSSVTNINSGTGGLNLTTGAATPVITTLGTTGSQVFASSTANSDRLAILPQSTTATAAFTGTITSSNLTAARTYTFPDASGEIALKSLGANWAVDGNAGTNPLTNFIGTTDNQDMVFRTNNTETMRIEALTGDMIFGGATIGTVKANQELIMRQDGDVNGSSILRLRNRNGENGAIFETVPAAGENLVDFIFKTAGPVQRNIRFEARGTARTGSPSFHIGGVLPDDPTLSVGDNYSAFSKPLRIGNYTLPTALLHLAAGTATASTAPLKFTSGPLLTTTEAGAIEFNNDSYYATITTGAGTAVARKTFAFLESPEFIGFSSAGADVNINVNSNFNTNINTGTSTGTVSIGSTSVGAGIVERVGTGDYSLNGVGASDYNIGAATTTGTISIGGTAQTGNLNLGVSTGSETVNLATGTSGIKTVHIADGATANVVTIGSTNGTASTTINAGTSGVTISNGLKGVSTTPTRVGGPGGGASNPLPTITGTNLAGRISITATAGAAVGIITTITFANSLSFPNGCSVIIQPGNATVANMNGSQKPYVSATSTTGFTISSINAALTNGSTYVWYYQVIGY